MKSVRWNKRPSLKQSFGHGLCLLLICLLTVSGVFLLFPSSVQAAPTILPSSLPNGQVGAPYTTTLVAAPLTCPCNWTVTSGSPPPGLNLNPSTGVIAGTPSTAGIYSFFV
ncbi:MAG: putative Ig domain-containing protein, partial [Chloroflexota bacterium]